MACAISRSAYSLPLADRLNFRSSFMQKPRVLITRQIPEVALDAIRVFAECDVWPEERPIPPSALSEKIVKVEGLLCLLTDRVDAAVLARAPALRVVSTMAAGFDHIDVEACSARGVPVGNTPGVLTETTADFAFALLMTAARRVAEGTHYVKEGLWKTWSPHVLLGQDIFGATLGLVGFGRIGQAVARRAQGFGMRVLVSHSRSLSLDVQQTHHVEQVSFETVVRKADFLSLHVPLVPATRHLIHRDALNDMQRTAVLVNTARGAVVETEALCHALREGQIAGAALDVTDPEPLPPTHPLLSLTNCVVVPHMASASVATRRHMAVMAAENLCAGLRQRRLPYCVNPEVYQ